MRILIFSRNFFPDVGGMETIIDTMAREFVARGHEVHLATTIPAPKSDPTFDTKYPYTVLRNPGPLALFHQVRWCDVYYQNDVFAKKAWPLLIIRRPWVIEYMLWRFGEPSKHQPLPLRHKLLIALIKRAATHMALSHALVRSLPYPATHVPNPFRSGLLRILPDVPRDRDIVFAGRVIREKGVPVLLQALSILQKRGRSYTATIVGKGNHLEEMKSLSTSLNLDTQVEFTGAQFGEEFARLLNRHDVMAVPSSWEEPFGSVTLEGIACGCAIVASDTGGLPEAVGPCGVLFPRNDPSALADRLEQLLEHREDLAKYRAPAQAHLAQFRQDVAADARLAVFQHALRRSS